MVGLIAVIVSSVVLTAWLFSLLDRARLDAMPPEQAGYLLGQVMGTVVFPTLISMALIGYRIVRAKGRDATRRLQEEPERRGG